ncbi:MFS transporter [Tumebacillus algifaecis]|nr:MFS transporter [Tumebacillus algifaecis]
MSSLSAGLGSLFSNRNFRNLWFGQTISSFGDVVYSISISWYVFEQTGSSMHVALLLVATFLPEVIFGMFLGALADRWNRKLLMQIADLFQFTATALLALSFWFGTFALWQIYLVSICLSLGKSLFSSSLTAWLPEIVEKEQLLRANSLMSTSKQVNRLFGATVGGILIAWAGAIVTIAIDSLTFLVSLGFLMMVRYRVSESLDRKTSDTSIWADIKVGLRWMSKQPIILLLVVIGMISNVALGPTNVLPPMYIQVEMQSDASALGLFDAAIGLGLLLGGILIGVVSPQRIGRWFIGGLGIQGLGMMLVALAPALPVACIGNFCIGFAVMMSALPLGTLIQVLTPSAMRGRVGSVMSIGLSLAIPITYGGIGVLAAQIGSRMTYVLGGGLLLSCVLLGILNPRLRGYSLNQAPVSTPTVEQSA